MEFNPFKNKSQENKNGSSPFVYEALAGDHVKDAFKKMVKISKEKNVDVVSDFNGDKLKVFKDSNLTPEELYGDYLEKQNEHMMNYHNSDKYKESKKKDAEELAKAQAKMKEFKNELATLDFNNEAVVLDWLCKYESLSWGEEENGSENVIYTFNKNGYKISTAALDPKFLHDKDKLARHIIGQALYGMHSHGAPHQIIHEHTKQWKKEFVK